MAHSPLADIEELARCSYCKQAFNEAELQPKVLACKHHFCLACCGSALLKGGELYCVHCWKRTDVERGGGPAALPTHAAALALAQRLAPAACAAHALPPSLWCLACCAPLCRACAALPDHLNHAVKPHADARLLLRQDFHAELQDMQKMLADIQRLVSKQREFLLKILEACTTLKTQVETDLVNNAPSYELSEARDCLQKAHQSYGATENQSPAEIHALLAGLTDDRERLQAKHHEMFLQCKLDDLIKNSGVIFDFDLLKQALAGIHSGEVAVQSDDGYHNPILFLANYCMSQLYSRHFLFKQQQQSAGPSFLRGQNGDLDYRGIVPAAPPSYVPLAMPSSAKGSAPGLDGPPKPGGANSFDRAGVSKLGFGDGSLGSPGLSKGFAPDGPSTAPPSLPPGGLISPPGALVPATLLPPTMLRHSPQPTLVRNPTSHVYPVYYFNVEINGAPFGRILVEVRSDVAPKMAKNFGVLTTGELGVGYKGCNVFQCWENESVITGDFELNNGRGGRSIFEESFFMPDDTKILASRGSVGMRRSQKRHDNLGLVGSQFRIILREMRGFTGIFAFVVEGLELVDRISQSGDSAGKPQSNVVIAGCGKFN